MAKNYSKLKQLFANDPEMLRSLESQEQAELLRGIVSKDYKFAESIRGEKGDQGEKGDKGEDGKDGLNGKTIFGMDGKDGKDGVKGKDGRNGIDGINGKNGLNGRDGKDGKDGKNAVLEDVVKALKEGKLLELRDIKGARLDMSDQRWHGGGISNITGLIQAGTNVTITGAGVTADPYIINSTGGSVSPLTTKGDVYGFSTVNARIPVGTDGQVLTADSAQALGVKWAPPSAGSITGSGVAGQATFWSGTSAIAGDTNYLWDNTLKLLTVGSATTLGKATTKINGGTLGGASATDNFLNVTGKFPTTTTINTNAVNFQLITAGSSAFAQIGINLNLLAGYTGNKFTTGIQLGNSALGTGVTGITNGQANFGFSGSANGSGTGNNVGGSMNAFGSSTLNLGTLGRSVSAANTPALNIGIVGSALNATTNIAGFFGLMSAAPTLGSSAALIADNGAVAADIFEARDNGSVVVTIADGGATTLASTLTLSTMTANSVLFAGTAGIVSQDNANFSFDDSNLLFQVGSITTSAFGSIKLKAGPLDVNGGNSFLEIIGTLPSGAVSSMSGIVFSISTSATSVATSQNGVNFLLNAGYTGSSVTRAFVATNNVAGTGALGFLGSSSNISFIGTTSGTTAGNNTGAYGIAQNSSSLNLGIAGKTVSGSNSAALNIGVVGLALNATVNVAGFFGLKSTAPTFGTTSALIADNGAVAADIFQARDNGTVKFSIIDGGNVAMTQLVSTYNNVATTGLGVPAIYGTGRSTAQTAAVASVATYTVGAADGSFYVSANANITAFVAGTFNVTVAYTDETNTAQTLKLNFASVTGTLGIALAAAGPYEGIPNHIRCKSGTTITIATAGTFTSLTYNVEGSIIQIN